MSDSEVRADPGTEGKAEFTAGNISSDVQQVQSGGSVASKQHPAISATEDEDESEDESDILEESPCGRWQKRREEVKQ